MKLSKNWSIGYDTYNVVLECRETRTKVDKTGENKDYESVESFYYPTLKQALKSYLQKSLKKSVFGLGEGGLVGCSNLAECVCPLLPNPCYMKCRLV